MRLMKVSDNDSYVFVATYLCNLVYACVHENSIMCEKYRFLLKNKQSYTSVYTKQQLQS